MSDQHEQKRVNYARRSQVEATLDRLEREDPTRWHHYLRFGWYAFSVIGLPVAIILTLWAFFRA